MSPLAQKVALDTVGRLVARSGIDRDRPTANRTTVVIVVGR
ncbi:hypothetical protein ACH4RA_27060 [Streptomyces smyrnaeus]|nr:MULTISPECIES: hypothetical protein [unclassified Streptomyces]